MKDIGEGTIRRIDWTELTPIVLLLRVLNISLGLRVLAIALVGFGLTELLAWVLHVPFWFSLARSLDFRIIPIGTNWLRAFDTPLPIVVGSAFPNLLEPYFTTSVWERPALLLWLPGVFLIWTLCGGMICRIVALRLTINESESIGNLFLFFQKRGISFISSLFILSLGILCCYLPIYFAKWLAAMPVWNYIVAILFPIPLLFAFFTVILTLGLAVGWMLLFAAVSTDGSDGFDAISRMFSYIFQRPLHYIFYWFCSGLLGWLGFFLVWFVCFVVMWLCHPVIINFPSPIRSWAGNFVQGFWLSIVVSIPIAYMLAWFWTSSVAIYLLLRRSVDATPFSEVYRAAPPKVRLLPTIKPDAHGAPEIKQTEPTEQK
jgi:hypothetical protein